jgi:hypothetical protein
LYRRTRGFDCSRGDSARSSNALHLFGCVDIPTAVSSRFSLAHILGPGNSGGNRALGPWGAGDQNSVRVFRHYPSLKRRRGHV